MKNLSIVLLVLVLLLFSFEAKAQTPPLTDDWPQVGKDSQHTGYSPETLGTNWRVAWAYPFQPDRVSPFTQAIIYRSKVFVGTEGDNGQIASLYALDAVNPATGTNPPRGQVLWMTPIYEPILNSVAADNGMVYFGTLNGSVYAVYTDTENGHNAGDIAWKQVLSTRYGFSTAPVIGDNKVLIGSRGGPFYALDPNDGHAIWTYDVGSPILHTAAYDQGRVFFGTMDMYVYALNTSPANPNDPATVLAWKSAKIDGKGFREFYPVITQGRVIVRTLNGPRDLFPMGYLLPAGPDYSDAAQDAALANYDAHPGNYHLTMHVLNEGTGQLMPAIIHDSLPAMDVTSTPPCVDRVGNIIIQAPAPNSWQNGWARASLTTRKVVQPLYDGTYAGYGNPDENNYVSCSNNLILNFQAEEAGIGAQYNGYFNLDTNHWTVVSHYAINSEMINGAETQGSNPPSISNGMVYNIGSYNLVARRTN